jgi:DNA-binding LacI/PurR family transcriptional regulator
MPVTLKDIAVRTGKSVPTVSRALAGFADISLQTRQEVQRIAQEMGYEPNAAARSLQRRRTQSLALILPTTSNLRFSDPFFSELLSGVVEQAAQLGFNVTVTTDAGQDEREAYLKHLRRGSADGYIVLRTQRHDSRIELLREQQVPFVAFGRVDGDNDFYLVDEDGTFGIRQAVDHLVALGHTRLACIAEPLTYTKSYHRVQGYLDGLQAHGLPFDQALLIESRFRQRSGKLAAQQLLDLPEPPTAIVACNDLLAFGAVSEAQARKLAVGRDVSITGFDDILWAEFGNPPLTTVRLPAHEVGQRVAEKLCQLATGEAPLEKQTILRPPLIVRQSTGARA